MPRRTALLRQFLPLVPLLLAAGCASDRSGAPSLALRPEERAYGTAQPAPPVPPIPDAAPLPPGSPGRIGSLADSARAAHARFTAQSAEADRLAVAARGAAPGSDARSRADLALAVLSTERSKAMVALADLDRMMIEAGDLAESGKGGADYPVFKATDADVSALVSAEDEVIARISGQLKG